MASCPTSRDETPQFSSTLLRCLEHILLVDRKTDPTSTCIRATCNLEESEVSWTWRPGKATEILDRFRNGQLSKTEPKSSNASSSMPPPSLLAPKSIIYSKKCVTSSEETTIQAVPSLRRPFRPPSRKPPSEAEANADCQITSVIPNVDPPSSNQGLFSTTQPQVTSSTKPPDTGFNFLGGHKRFHSNARGFLQKRSYNRKKDSCSEDNDDDEPEPIPVPPSREVLTPLEVPANQPFRSAYEVMVTEDKARGIKRTLAPPGSTPYNAPVNKIPKIAASKNGNDDDGLSENPEVNLLMADERLKNVEPKMVEAILNEVVELGASTDWNDIAGLEGVKGIIREIIIWPMQRPDLFTGLRGPPKGILLFGPPGTGKTMFGRLIATKSSSTFFNISASSLMSKWCGDGEKMVRALFQVARVKQPSVVFIDEIDSILTQRSDSEHETSRRLKTEFLIQFDGCATKSDDKLLVIGVTNRPQELDEAARRRLVKRIYIPLPEANGRKQLIRNLLADQNTSFTEEDYEKVACVTSGYSGADMASLCKEAAYGPIRDIGQDIQTIQLDKVRPIQFQDFELALKHVKASVASSDLKQYETWDKQFGCHV